MKNIKLSMLENGYKYSAGLIVVILSLVTTACGGGNSIASNGGIGGTGDISGSGNEDALIAPAHVKQVENYFDGADA